LEDKWECLTVSIVPGVVLLGPILVGVVLGLVSDLRYSDLRSGAEVTDGLGHGGDWHDDIGSSQVVDVLVASLVSVNVARGGELLLLVIVCGGGVGGQLRAGGGRGLRAGLGAGGIFLRGEGRSL